MTSIVILTFNKLDYTKKCIESIRKYTDKGSYEIIVVDNASSDGTIKWLKEQSDIIIILNNDNVGFPRGCNKGIEVAKGSEILLLNNDVIVTPNWLNNMLNALYHNKKIGAVGPVTNSAPGQEIDITYTSEGEVENFGRETTNKYKGKWIEKTKLVGFCMLIKKSVLDKVGVLDEIFSPGNYEDDDLSFRIILAGYKLLLCYDVFIHHFGSISFKKDVGKFKKLLSENELKFKGKWGINLDQLGICRTDLMELMDLENRDLNILEIGCGIGNTLLEIKNINSNAKLYAIEKNKQAGLIAANFSEVIIGDVEEVELLYEKEYFDYVIMGDLLECIYEPKALMLKLKPLLKRKGEIIVSCKNVQNSGIIQKMLLGKWDFNNIDTEGIRFYTLKELHNLFCETGYRVKQYSQRVSKDLEKFIDFNEKLLKTGLVDSILDFNVFQWLFKISAKAEIDENMKIHITEYLKLMEEQNISNVQIEDFIKNLINLKMNEEELFFLVNDIVQNVEKVIVDIAVNMFKLGYLTNSIKLLLETYKRYNENIDIIYTLAFLLNINGDKNSAINLLKSTKVKSEILKELLKEIKSERF